MQTNKLLTQALLTEFRTIWDQELSKDPIIICKFFHPASQRTRYATELDENTGIFFWYVIGIESERGTFSLYELLEFKDRYGLEIERDRHFTKCLFSQLVQKEGL